MHPMKKITLSTAKHRTKNVLSIRFAYDEELKNHLKNLDNVLWSSTLRCFYMERSLENIRIVVSHFKNPKWTVVFFSS